MVMEWTYTFRWWGVRVTQKLPSEKNISMKMGLPVSEDFELTEFELVDSKILQQQGQILGKMNIVRVNGEF